MTSSNGNDWFDPVQDGPVRVRVRTELDQGIYSQLAAVAECECRSITDQIRYFIKLGLSQQNASLDCDGVSVREGEGGSKAVPQDAVKAVPQKAVPAVPSSSSLEPKVCLGKESEDTLYRSRRSSKREFPACLEEFEQQITDFWKEKKGSKSERAWTLLMKELSAIHAHLNVSRSPANRERFLEQLELATANRWQSITLKNFKQFSDQPSTPGTKPWQKEEKPYHVPGQFRQGIPTVNLEEVHRRQAEEEAAKKARENF